MLEYFLAGAGLRFSQVVIYSSMWIVIGCLIAGIFRRMLGPEKTRRIFGNGTKFGLLAGWLIGMLLPVCSLGVIPIVRELHRVGVNRGTIVAFGLTAPLFNPMSVLYGLTLSDPIAILSFSLCALFIVSVLGFFWDRFTTVSEKELLHEKMPVPGIRRTIAVFDSATRELVSPTMLFILLGIAGSVLLAVVFPKGFLQNQVERDNILAPITVALIATPVYSTPLLAMSQIGGMFQHGNSIGAAFSLLILGAGANLGLLCWFGITYGMRRVAIFCLLLLVITVGLAYVIDKPLRPKGVEPAGHSHAFDVYTHPFAQDYNQDQYGLAKTKALNFHAKNEVGATYILLGMILVGLMFGMLSTKFDLEKWYLVEKAKTSKNMDIILPGWFLGIVSVVGLVVASVVGCYLYYPKASEALADLSIVNADVVISSKQEEWEAAEKWISYADDISRRMEVGAFLRNFKIDEFQTTKARIYREKLDTLKESVDGRDASHVEERASDVNQAYFRLRKAFAE